MPKPPSINSKGVTSHENAAVREDVNNLNGLDRPKTARRADDKEPYKKTGAAYQRNEQIPHFGQ